MLRTTIAPGVLVLAVLLGAFADEKPPRTDLYGDPLPPGAIARMGTVELRHRHNNAGVASAFSPDGKMLVTGGTPGLQFWNVATGKLLREMKQFNCIPSFFSHDGKWLAAESREGIRFFDPATGQLLRTIPGLVAGLIQSRDSKLLAAGEADGVVTIRN